MCPGPCRRDLGFEGPISPPRTKGGEIEPPKWALDLVPTPLRRRWRRTPSHLREGGLRKQSEKKQPRNKIKSQTRGMQNGRSPYTNTTAGRLWNGTPPYPRNLSIYIPFCGRYGRKTLVKRNMIIKNIWIKKKQEINPRPPWGVQNNGNGQGKNGAPKGGGYLYYFMIHLFCHATASFCMLYALTFSSSVCFHCLIRLFLILFLHHRCAIMK